jgi:hypothetical protein
MIPLALLWVVCAIGASFIASGRGADGFMWFLMGCLLGPVGLLLAFGAGPGTMRCPACAEDVLAIANKCRHCGEALTPKTINNEKSGLNWPRIVLLSIVGTLLLGAILIGLQNH